jgi:hypothetical protein
MPSSGKAYVRAFIAGAFHGATHTHVQAMLEGSRNVISSFISLHLTLANEIDLKSFAITFATVERRLGVNTNVFVKYFFVLRCLLVQA